MHWMINLVKFSVYHMESKVQILHPTINPSNIYSGRHYRMQWWMKPCHATDATSQCGLNLPFQLNILQCMLPFQTSGHVPEYSCSLAWNASSPNNLLLYPSGLNTNATPSGYVPLIHKVELLPLNFCMSRLCHVLHGTEQETLGFESQPFHY